MITPAARGEIGKLNPVKSVTNQRGKGRRQYGQNKLLVGDHVLEIVNLPSVKGTPVLKIHEFCAENLRKNYEALVTMG